MYVDYLLCSKVFHTYCYESSISSNAVNKSIDLLHTYFSLFILCLFWHFFLWVTALTLTTLLIRKEDKWSFANWYILWADIESILQLLETDWLEMPEYGEAGGYCPQLPVFGRSVNPIPTKGSKLCLPHYYRSPRFLDGAASLLFVHPKCKLQNWSYTSNKVRYELQSLYVI